MPKDELTFGEALSDPNYFEEWLNSIPEDERQRMEKAVGEAFMALAPFFKEYDTEIHQYKPYALAVENIMDEIPEDIGAGQMDLAMRMVRGYVAKYSIEPGSAYDNEDEHDRLYAFIMDYLAQVKSSLGTETITRELTRFTAPQSFSFSINKLATILPIDIYVNDDTKKVKVGSKGKPLSFLVALTYDGDDLQYTGRHKLTAYDQYVHDAVTTLLVEHPRKPLNITAEQIYRTMLGDARYTKVSPAAVEDVRISMEKAKYIRVQVDFTDEARAYKWPVDKFTIDSPLLNFDVIRVSKGDHEQEFYSIKGEPPLYTYAKLSRQIARIPLGRIDTKDATRSTGTALTIKAYLLRRIERMKNDETPSLHKIKYDTIFEYVGVADEKSRTQRSRHKTVIKKLLGHWVNTEYIKGFTEYTSDSKSKAGVEIVL